MDVIKGIFKGNTLKLQDVFYLTSCIKAIPRNLRDRTSVIHGLCKDFFNWTVPVQENEIGIAIQTFEKILPRYNDNPLAISSEMIPQNWKPIHIYPTITGCCGKQMT